MEGKRSSLFFQILEVIDEVQPPFVFLENVPNIRTKGAERVCKELAERGYDCRWCCISASDVGALHKRERWFLLGYSEHNGSFAFEEQRSSSEAVSKGEKRKNEARKSKGASSSGMLAYTCYKSKRGLTGHTEKEQPPTGMCGQHAGKHAWQKAVSEICRTTDGVSHRVDRLRSLGNSVVPLQAKTAFEFLSGGGIAKEA